MSEFFKRVTAGLVLIPLALFLVLYKNPLPLGICLYVTVFLGNREMRRLLRAGGENVSTVSSVAGALIFPLCFYLKSPWEIFGLVLSGYIIFIFLIYMFSPTPTQGTIRFISSNLFGGLFVPFFMSFLWLIRDLHQGEFWLLFLLVTIWMSDSSAYFVGRKIGTLKIVPKISPKKSLQGFVAGLVCGTAAGFIYYFYILRGHADLHYAKVVMIAFDVAVAGIAGDLFESMLKRDAGIKDSGNLIPGHGGILDRFDSVVISAPVLYMYLNAWL